MVQLAKGVRDFPPKEKIVRDKFIQKLRLIFERYGFNPLETPIIERLETFNKKAGGSEIMKEVFKLSDQGNRELALRFDLTVPLSRFISMNPNIKLPFKRYQIGRVFRDGPIKLGRYREFRQCDVDIIGVSGPKAEQELLLLTKRVFKEFDIPVEILVNDRIFLNALLSYAKIDPSEFESVLITLDKLEKIGLENVKLELKDKGISEESISLLVDLLSFKGDNKAKLDYYKKLVGEESLKNMGLLIDKLDFISFAPFLARGLNYYTGTIFEVKYVDQSKFGSSLAGGGRYDKLIGKFVNNNKEYPAIGISFGLEPVLDLLKLLDKIELKNSLTDVFIIPIDPDKTYEFALGIAEKLRSELNVEVDLIGRSVKKNLDYVTKQSIDSVIFIGENEMSSNMVKLKIMSKAKELNVGINELVNVIKDEKSSNTN